MGQAAQRSRRKEPIVEKESSDGSDDVLGLSWGVSCMQGWRSKMEDAHLAIPSLDGRGWEDTALFAVMDGHGGPEVANFCSQHMPDCVTEGWSTDVEGSLRTAFLSMDEMLRDPPASSTGYGCRSFRPHSSGCTAVACCIRSDEIVVANAGDSRAVLCRGGQAFPLSEDHKPNLPVETDRIHKAGGYVEQELSPGCETVYRVNGDLALSRAIGDLDYKTNELLDAGSQIISAVPDVKTFRRQAYDEFLVIACDGVWEVLSNEEVVEFVQKRLRSSSTQAPLSAIVEELLDYIVSPNPSQTRGLGGDNMTAILVVFSAEQSLDPFQGYLHGNEFPSQISHDDLVLQEEADDVPQCRFGLF